MHIHENSHTEQSVVEVMFSHGSFVYLDRQRAIIGRNGASLIDAGDRAKQHCQLPCHGSCEECLDVVCKQQIKIAKLSGHFLIWYTVAHCPTTYLYGMCCAMLAVYTLHNH